MSESVSVAHRFRIDVETGSLFFPDLKVSIERLSRAKALPAVFHFMLGPVNDMRTGWFWRNLSPLTFEGHPVGMMLGYHDSRLEMLYWSLISGSDGWPSYEECMAEEKVLRSALEAQLGVPFRSPGEAQFAWGNVYCSYDPKGGFTSAGINYTFFR